MKTLCLLALLVLLLLVLASTAAAQTATVTLAWNPSAGTNVIVNYRIYYGVVSQTYTNLGNVSVGTNLTATVTNLVRGNTYYFAATATDNNGLESAFSNEVAYRPATPPSPPTVLRAVSGN